MKRILDIGIKALLSVGMVVLFILHFDSNDSLVYVDSQKLVSGYKGMAAARQEFETKVSIWKSNLDTLDLELQTSMKEYEQKKASLTTREKQLTEELIRSKQQEYVSYQQIVQERVQKEDKELSRRVMDKVDAYLKNYGKEKGYRIIFAATQYGNIVYAEDVIDVTSEVMDGLNEEYTR